MHAVVKGIEPLYTQRPSETTETQKTYKQKIERKNNISSY
jgi:hypothetical protein